MSYRKLDWTEEKIQFIIQQYSSQKMDTYQLAKYFNCSNDTISRKLKANGIVPHKFYEDLTNKIFGKLTVLRKSPKSSRRLYWECQCECGKIITVKGDDLRQQRQFSCGCLQSKGEYIISELLKQNGVIFDTQYRFQDFVSEHNNIPYRFDFAVLHDNGTLNYLIEYDGEFHYRLQKKGGYQTEEQYKHRQFLDSKKDRYCLERNIPLIRIPYYIRDKLTIGDLLIETTKYLVKESSNSEALA